MLYIFFQVSLKYVQQLCEIDEKHSLKLAPHLKLKHLNPSHYDKMNVSTACALFNHSITAALRLLVEQKKMEDKALTTAWFLDKVFRWFSLMTSRTPTLALSDLCPQKGKETEAFLGDFIEMFRKLQIFDQSRPNASWKPVQTGMIITTTTALNLRELYVRSKGLKFLMLSRFSQDALENLFSAIRVKSPVPRAREFKYTLRLIVLAQFFKPSKHGSYDTDDSVHLTDFLCSRPDLSAELEPVQMPVMTENLVPEEQESLEYLAGYIAQSVSKKHGLCDHCKTALVETDITRAGLLLQLKNYVANKSSLCTPSASLMSLLECAETYYRKNEASLVAGKLQLKHVGDLIAAIEPAFSALPTCHDVASKVVQQFLLCRLRFSLRKNNEEMQKKAPQRPKCASKSVGMRAAVSNVK